jgi:erythromycin esterase
VISANEQHENTSMEMKKSNSLARITSADVITANARALFTSADVKRGSAGPLRDPRCLRQRAEAHHRHDCTNNHHGLCFRVMTRPRCRALLLVLFLASSLSGATRHRAIAHPPPEAPADWLASHAIPLATTEATGSLDDLAPLAAVVGDAHIVGLGDATHGTHEFFTVKLRIIQFLVQRMGFDVLAMEHSFPQTERINTYVQGGPGDLKQLLQAGLGETTYWFWDVEEFAAVVEWMRNYNLTRGTKPPIEIFGADVYDGKTAAHMVVDYLNTVDPAAADAATQAYTCLWANQNCNATPMRAIPPQMAAKESDYTARSSPRSFANAVHAADVVNQLFAAFTSARDPLMGLNVAWAKDHRSSAGKVIYWAHDEHIARGSSLFGVIAPVTAGELLTQTVGSDYVNFGFASWAGQFLTLNGTTFVMPSFTPAGPDDYETFFHASSAPNIIVPLRDPHPFLASPHHMRESGSGYTPTAPTGDYLMNLTSRFNGVVFIDQTSPNHPLP